MVLLVNETIAGPATHAFVVGVSRYPHLRDGSQPTLSGTESGLRQLTSAARSASEFAAWLMTEYHNPNAPLGT